MGQMREMSWEKTFTDQAGQDHRQNTNRALVRSETVDRGGRWTDQQGARRAKPKEGEERRRTGDGNGGEAAPSMLCT